MRPLPEGVSLRRATPADAAAITRTRRDMFLDMGLPDDARLTLACERFAETLPDDLANGRYTGWLAEADGRIVGGAGVVEDVHSPSPANPSGRIAYVLNVWVDPAWRRRSIASALVETAVAWARAEGFGMASLHASEAGAAVYPSLGFKPSNEMRLPLDA
jgi:GNAT superfamily N-acetyltransferase